MSELNPPTVDPVNDDGIAEAYIDRELVRTRTNLSRMRIIVIGSVLFVGIYIGYITSGFRENLQPTTAAVITTSLVNQRMDEVEPQFATFMREKIPETIRRAPDYALEHMPEFRKSIEDQVEADLRAHAKTTSDHLIKELEEFLVLHKTQVEAMLSEPNKPAVADEMGAALEDQFRTYLSEQAVAGETIQSRLDKTLKAMDEVERRTTRLVMNKNLTPTEQKTRRAIAILMRRIDQAKEASPEQTLDPAAIKDAVDKIKAPTLPN